MKEWYKSKTIWLAMLQGISATLIVVHTEFPSLGYLVLIKSLIDVWLRVITATSLK